jgi:uncharacterized protein (TIGR00645 family)
VARMERLVERLILASRWLLAPLYLGLALVLALFVAEFFLELAHIVRGMVGDDQHFMLAALSLLDLVLVASLIVMIMLSGYENFVAKIALDEVHEALSRLTQLGIGSLKVKIMSSLAIISGIDLLEQFFTIEQVSNEKLIWLVALHATFVVTTLIFAVVDRLAEH